MTKEDFIKKWGLLIPRSVSPLDLGIDLDSVTRGIRKEVDFYKNAQWLSRYYFGVDPIVKRNMYEYKGMSFYEGQAIKYFGEILRIYLNEEGVVCCDTINNVVSPFGFGHGIPLSSIYKKITEE